MGKLEGKIAVVTGGSSGIGLATAKLFVAEGAKVLIVSVEQDALDTAVAEIGLGVEALYCDISNMADLDAVRSHIETRYAQIDVLFANAGGGRPGPLVQVSEHDFDFTVDTNFKGTFFTVQKLVPLMMAGGAIILNTSIQSAKAYPDRSVYAATKAAVRSLTRALTAELASSGIRANAVAPGYIDTDILRKSGVTEELIQRKNELVREQVPLRRMGSAEEVAKVVLFLASQDASYVTGVELAVDGGIAQI